MLRVIGCDMCDRCDLKRKSNLTGAKVDTGTSLLLTLTFYSASCVCDTGASARAVLCPSVI